MLSNISIPLLGIVDTAILGHLEQAIFLGAVSIGANIMAMVLWTFSFLRTSTTGLTAQQHGADDTAAIQQTLLRAMLLSLLIASVLLILRDPLIRLALDFVSASASVDELALRYCQIRFISVPAILLTYCLTGWLIGMQNTRAVMAIIITTNVINIVLDFVFIIHLGMNSEGAAWATVMAESSGCLIGLTIWYRHRLARSADRALKLDIRTLLNAEALRRLVQMNADLAIRTSCLLFCFLFFTAKGAQQNDSILAANALLLQLVLFAAFALDGFAHAAESLCGFALGQRRLDRFYATVRACLLWCLGTTVVLSLALWLGKNIVVYSYSSIAAVQQEMAIYFVWLLLLPVAAVWCYLLDGVFIGAAQTKAMRDSMLACALFIFLPVWYLTQPMGNHGLWLAFLLFNLCRGLSLGGYYFVYSKQGRWLAA